MPGDTYVPETERSERRSAERAPLCPDGETRAQALRRATVAVPEHGIEVGDTIWTCLTYGIVYPRPIADGVLLEVFFDGDWGLVPPG